MNKNYQSQQHFKLHYLNGFRLKVFKNNNTYYLKKISSLKRNKDIQDYKYLLVTNYLQLLENFVIISVVVLSDLDIRAIFSHTKKINLEFEKIFHLQENTINSETDRQDAIRNKLKSKNIKNDFIEKYIGDNNQEYLQILTQLIEDYTKLKDILNSYKHGFRLNSFGDGEIIFGTGNTHYSIGKFDSSVVFYTKKADYIFENLYYFNWEYIGIKYEFLDNIMENLIKNFLNVGKKFKKTTIYVKDKKILDKYGSYLEKKEIFQQKII